MLPKGKLAVFVIPATEKDILMKIASDEAEVDSAEQDSFFLYFISAQISFSDQLAAKTM
jgi:hypothetical protein